jgi:serine/threonine-protein kinase
MNSLLGQRLGGKYELQAELGRGGMGIVYRAHDAMLRRSVAVKVLAPQLAADPSFVERFRHEAIAAANLRHPNIATVYDVGQDMVRGDAVHFLVMEFVEGQTLDRVLQRQGQPFSLPQTDEIIRQVAQALHYAHQRGMIHRDVKPANIMLGQDGHVTLMDFGLVRAGELSQLTQTGTALGTPAYMAPEQIMGAEVDRRTDVYALGVVIYELLTGDVPFRRTTPLATVHAQVYDPPPPLREKRPELPAPVESVVLRALAKNPGGRYGDVTGLASDFSRAITGQMPEGLAEGWDERAAPMGATIRAPAPQPPRAPSATASPPAPGAGPQLPAPPSARPRQPASPWLWVAVALAVLALGAGALAAAGFFRSSTPVATVATTPGAPPSLSAEAGGAEGTRPAVTAAPSVSQAGQGMVMATTAATENTPTTTPTAIVTSTPLPPVPTVPLAAQAEVIGDVLNVRSGPGVAYAVIGQARRGTAYDVVGRDASGAWWQICCVNGDAGWVASNLVRVSGAADAVAVVDVAPPTPAPATNTPTVGPTAPTTLPTFTPTPTLTPTPTPTLTPTPTPTLTLTPCASTAGPTFARVWQRSLMGCPVSSETGVTSAYEAFERGFMLWRKDNDGHYAVFDDGGFSRFIFPSGEPPEFACIEAAQLGRPKRGFSTVWCENSDVRQRIGNALDDEIGNDRPLQVFEQGFMVFIPERNAIYALLDNGSWRRFD